MAEEADVSGKELLSQLASLNESCRKALEEDDFRRLKALMQLKKELLTLLKDSPFSSEDVPAIEKALRQEEELASLALSKKKSLEERLAVSNLH